MLSASVDLLLLFLLIGAFGGEFDDQGSKQHLRIRRRIGHRPARLEKSNDSVENEKQKFLLKCPRIFKNISSIVWTQNDRPIFIVEFTPDGKPEASKSVDPSWQVEEKVWRSIENHFGLILMAKRGRYKVEVENARAESGHQWIALRINEVNLAEDGGDWKCRVFVRDGMNGSAAVKLGAESRKRIEPKPNPRKTREFGESSSSKLVEDGRMSYDVWESFLEGRTFGFAKNDGESVVFQRPNGGGLSARIGDAIEYTRNEPGPGDALDMDELGAWRWRRARSNSAPKIGGISKVIFSAIFSVFFLLQNIL